MYQVKGVNEKGKYHLIEFENYHLAKKKFEQMKKNKYKTELIIIEYGIEEILLSTERRENELSQ